MGDVLGMGQSADYRTKRAELLAAEKALRDQRERVAEMRRALPPGAIVETDYVFREGPADLSDTDPARVVETRLSALFSAHDTLIVEHLMFGEDWDAGCPMCGLFVDGLDAIAPYVATRTAFVVIAKAEIAKMRAWGRSRGWRHLRLLSSQDNDFNADFGVEWEGGEQLPALSVFTRSDGTIRHAYITEGSLVFEHHRMMDLYSPVWNLFDLLPQGRGDWFPKPLQQAAE